MNGSRRLAGPEVTTTTEVTASVPDSEETTAPAMPCADCGFDTIVVEYYMVHDHVWAAAGMGPDEDSGFLCIGCLERRLGRPLIGGDFPPHLPINWPDLWWHDDTPRLRTLKVAAAELGGGP